MKKKNLPVPVLAEPTEKDGAGDHLAVGGEARESTTLADVESACGPESHSRGGQKPSNVPQKEWDYACERAKRAREYAAMFPMRPHDLRMQDPLWQWENEVKGRYNHRVGGA